MSREPSLLQRFHLQSANNPLQGWFVAVGIQSVVGALLLWLFPDARKPGMVFLLACSTFASPTVTLLGRFFTAERSKNPVPPRQEEDVGRVALIAAWLSIAALFIGLFQRRMDWFASQNVQIGALFGYVLFLLIAIAFGFAGRHTKYGLLGLRTAIIWVTILTVTGLLLLLQSR